MSMFKYTKITLVLSFFTLGLASCLKPESFPNEPSIEFVDFTALGDSGRLTFNFTDGDGDIGLSQTQLSPPFDTSSYFYYNLYIHYYEKMNGGWVRGTADPGGNNFPTADSITSSCSFIAFSTSAVPILCPETFITSSTLPRILKYPS